MGDDPTEEAQEHIHHEAAHGHGPKWISAAALTAALLAVLAAISASRSSNYLTKSTLTRIDSNDAWLEFDSDSVKRSNIYTRDEFWASAAAEPRTAMARQHDDDQKKKAEYATPPENESDPSRPLGMKGMQKHAAELQENSAQYLETHERFENAETLFHIAIAIVAIAVVAKRKEFWYVSIVGGVVGLWFFGAAFAKAPSEKPAKENAATEHVTGSEHATTGASPATAAHETAATEHH